MSDGSINTASFRQLIEKMREQAPLAGITAAQQERIVAFITDLEAQPTVHPLLTCMTR